MATLKSRIVAVEAEQARMAKSKELVARLNAFDIDKAFADFNIDDAISQMRGFQNEQEERAYLLAKMNDDYMAILAFVAAQERS